MFGPAVQRRILKRDEIVSVALWQTSKSKNFATCNQMLWHLHWRPWRVTKSRFNVVLMPHRSIERSEPAGSGTEACRNPGSLLRDGRWMPFDYSDICTEWTINLLWIVQTSASSRKYQKSIARRTGEYVCVQNEYFDNHSDEWRVILCVLDQLCRGQRWREQFLVLICEDAFNEMAQCGALFKLLGQNLENQTQSPAFMDAFTTRAI